MAIFKAKVDSNYATIPNSALQDDSLSYEATGLLAMMLSLPDDWEIHKTWLQSQKIKCGRDKLSSIMKELVDSGYVRKQVKQDESGKLDGVDWLVYAEPTVLLKNRQTVSPSDVKSDTTKETSIKKETSNKGTTKRFQKPSIEDIHDYMVERNYNSKPEAEKLYDYYESNGWYVGKKQMKCWKASVRNWLRNAPKLNSIPVPQKPIAYDIQQDFDLL